MGAHASEQPLATGARLSARARYGRIILTIALVVSPIAMAAFLFNAEHIFSPAWHPHARYHVAELAGIGVATSVLGLGLLWRRTSDRIPGTVAAAVLAAAPPLAEFGALLAPGASPIPDENNPNTLALWGTQIPGNLVAFAFMLVFIAVGLALSLWPDRATERDS